MKGRVRAFWTALQSLALQDLQENWRQSINNMYLQSAGFTLPWLLVSARRR